MKKILTIMVSTMILLASTIGVSVSAANGGENNEVQSGNTEKAITSCVSATSTSTTNTQVSTNSSEETTSTTSSTTTSTTTTETETTTNSTTISTSTNSGTTTSETGTTAGTTSTSATSLTAGLGTTSTGFPKPHKDMPPIEIVVDGVKYIILTNGETRIAPNQTRATTTITSTTKSTTTTNISGAPKTGDGTGIGKFAACGAAAVIAVGLMIFGKKEE